MVLKNIFYYFTFLFLLLGCLNPHKFSKITTSPKNVIFLISDGAGLSQISSAFFYKDSSVNYSRFKNIGLIHTFSSDNDITDSAASATAFSTGEKTYNGAIGVSDDFKPLENITEIASKKGVKVGLVSTSSVTHATPATFYAHTKSRNFQEEIALQLSKSEIDYFAGGGTKFFNQRNDGINLLDTLNLNGFNVNTNELDSFVNVKKDEKLAYLLASDGMPKIIEGRGHFLKNATILGIDFLRQENNPFFIISEGAQIDWAGHDNDANYLITELIDFDNTIGAVLDFAENDGETLVIVTSDHETGGFTLAGKPFINHYAEIDEDYSTILPSFSTDGHSATLIPVFAFGPGAEEFSGVYDNTEIFHKILKLTSWNK